MADRVSVADLETARDLLMGEYAQTVLEEDDALSIDRVADWILAEIVRRKRRALARAARSHG